MVLLFSTGQEVIPGEKLLKHFVSFNSRTIVILKVGTPCKDTHAVTLTPISDFVRDIPSLIGRGVRGECKP